MSHKSPIEILYGGGGLGASWSNTLEEVDEYFSLYASKGYKSIDTSFVDGQGRSEVLIGEFKAQEKGWIIDTKANPFAEAAHNAASLRASLETSFARLQVKKVRIFYLHGPTDSTPLLETLKGIDALHKEGKFERFGVSNFLAKDVEELVRLADEHNLIKVSAYQGHYNAIARRVESELFPVLRKNNIAFVAYSPTAGGFFQEKHALGQDTAGRFHGDNMSANIYRYCYFKPEYFEALKEFLATVKQHPDASPIDIALRWVVYHSPLKSETGDAVILGGSKKSHLEEGLQAIGDGPLDQWAVDALDQFWDKVKGVAPLYGRELGGKWT